MSTDYPGCTREDEERWEALREEVRTLEPPYRKVMEQYLLLANEGESIFNLISKVLGRPVSGVKQWYRRGLEKLRGETDKLRD